MKRMLDFGLLMAGLLWAASTLGAASGVPIEDPLRVDFPAGTKMTEAAVGEKIKQMALAKNWRVDNEKPGRLSLSTIVNNKHGVRVDIDYSATGYTLRYVGSDNLRYRPQSRTIHPNYNMWMKDFCTAINGGLGVTALVSVPLTFPASGAEAASTPGTAAAAPAAGAVAAAAAQPPSDGMPATGTKWRYGYRDRQYDRGERFFTVEVAGVEQSRVRERMAVDGGTVTEAVIDADRFAFGTRQVGSGTSIVELTPYVRFQQNRSSQPPAGYPSPGGAIWKVSYPQYVEEVVQVPAGNFKAVRVQVSGTSEAFGSMITGTARFMYTAWYAPELGRYVKIQHQTWNRQNGKIGDEQVQLVAYQLGK